MRPLRTGVVAAIRPAVALSHRGRARRRGADTRFDPAARSRCTGRGTMAGMRRQCRTHGGARGIHENGSGGCEWVPVPELTEQEWEIVEAIRQRDGRQDGELARLLALWARGELRIVFDPLDHREVERLVLRYNRVRGVGFGQPLRPYV